MTSIAIDPETAILGDPSPTARCPYCDRPFDTEQSCDLHVGEAHPDEATEAETAAYEKATAAEEQELWLYRLKLIVGLGVVYAVIALVYVTVLGIRFG
jgi:hypothetical protein